MNKAKTSAWAAIAWLAVACGNDEGAEGSGLPAATSGIDSFGDPTEGDPEDQADATGEIFDVGEGAEGGNGGDCPGGSGMMGDDFEFSFIWIANSPEGTVSKINTFTGVEEGRYRTGEGNPDPSRTSVNQLGDVAVANRNGGIVKIAANVERCVDANGNGTIETSKGPDDILPWGSDECLLWSHPLPATGADGPRPVAWEAVDSNCSVATPRVWVGYYTGEANDVGVFQRLDGTTGDVLDEVMIPGWNTDDRNNRPYGGAVNAEGDFYVTGYYGPGAVIDSETLDYEMFPPPAGSGFYGMALATDEDMWIGGCDGAIYHFEQDTQSFTNVGAIEGRARGVQVDTEGRAWFAGNNPCRLIEVDTLTETIVDDNIPLPGCGEPVGISIDGEGFVWVVDRTAEVAYKVDPDTHEIALTVEGLVEPYTYSDMTGQGLSLVTNPPTG